MKYTFSLTLILFHLLCHAQQPTAALQKMVETEKAFAQTSIDKGTKQAFLDFLADDASLIEKGQPVNGKEEWKNKDFKGVITWQPNFAEIAGSGDFGYTTGNWQLHSNNATDPATNLGSFATVWRKQTDGSWKVIFDMGVTHPDARTSANSVTESYPVFKPETFGKNQTGPSEKFVFMTDFFYWKNAKTALNPIEPHLSQNVRVLYNNQMPISGKANAVTFLKKSFSKTLLYTGLKALSSPSGDLTCVYGIISGDGKSGSYMRVWKQESKGVWKIVLEVVNLERI